MSDSIFVRLLPIVERQFIQPTIAEGIVCDAGDF